VNLPPQWHTVPEQTIAAIKDLGAEVERLREELNDLSAQYAKDLGALADVREELADAALRNDRLLNVVRGEETLRREAEASRDRLAEAIASALTSLGTGTMKDGYAYAVLSEALQVHGSRVPAREDG
jgi:chromosome segregation ATPase